MMFSHEVKERFEDKAYIPIIITHPCHYLSYIGTKRTAFVFRILMNKLKYLSTAIQPIQLMHNAYRHMYNRNYKII